MDETWLCHCDRETKNDECNGGITAHSAPKKFREQKSAGRVLASIFFLGSRRRPPHYLSSKGPNYQRRVLLISAGAIVGHFEGKNAAGRSPRGSCSCTTMLRLTGHLQPQNKLACLGFQCLDHPPYSPDLAPLDYHLFPGLEKKLKGRNFSSNAEAIAAAETWLDGQPSNFFFLEWLAKFRATG